MNTKNKYDVGTLHKSFNGTMVEVLEVIKGSKRRVRFLEDNSETICTTNSLRDGNLVNRNTFIEKYGIGTIHKTNNGTYCKVIEKIDVSKRRVVFLEDNSEIICTTSSLMKNSLINKNTTTTKFGIGTVHEISNGDFVKIISKTNRKNKVIVEFKNGNTKEVDISALDRKDVKDPLNPNVYGIGYIGDGKYKLNKNDYYSNKRYKTWQSMFDRCYGKNRTEPYKNTTVCEEWHNYQNFAKWYEETYPKHIEGIDLELDKDLLSDENCKIYSPKTCIFLPKKVNSFLSVKTTRKREFPTGVHEVEDGKYKAQINSWEDGRKLSLGTFNSIEEAKFEYDRYKIMQIEKVKGYLRSLNYLSEDIIQMIR